MMSNENSHTLVENVKEGFEKHESSCFENYSELLKEYGISYKEAGYYLQVREIAPVQGWILHISLLPDQCDIFFPEILPLLTKEEVAFKIPINRYIHSCLLDGSLGYAQLGNIVCIYSQKTDQVKQIAQKLVSLTASFEGINIPTDAHLGGLVFTRYGGFNTFSVTDIFGSNQLCFYDSKGTLVKDVFSIPFSLKQGIEWPFSEIKPFVKQKKSKIIGGKYLPYIVIKADAKGRVIKGINIKRMKYCLIKEGKKHMLTDEVGRDIRTRLSWQEELHKKLGAFLAIPRIFDSFEYEGDRFLVMEFIDGKSLDQWQTDIFEGNCWRYLDKRRQLLILDNLLKVLSIIEKMHANGYIHRDITPANFLINKKGQLYLIDLELVYNTLGKRPSPPFKVGTPGYISPEQLATHEPTVKEDIYGIGGLLIATFLKLSPLRIEKEDKAILKHTLFFFIGNHNVVDLIIRCQDENPSLRPSLMEIKNIIQLYKVELNIGLFAEADRVSSMTFDSEFVQYIIQSGLSGICSSVMVDKDKLWYSRSIGGDGFIGNEQIGPNYSTGFYNGVSGVCYLLSVAAEMGYKIDSCRNSFEKGWQFIANRQLKFLPHLNPGFYNGAAGIAVAITHGIKSELLPSEKKYKDDIQRCLSIPVLNLDIASGAAGQGIALIQCADYLPTDFVQQKLRNIKDYIISAQQKNGSWKLLKNDSGNTIRSLGLSSGTAGIIYFLLLYMEQSKNQSLQKFIVPALASLIRKWNRNNYLSNWTTYAYSVEAAAWLQHGNAGITLCLLKAFEILQDEKYKQAAETILSHYPFHIFHNDLTLSNGLAGLGEVYLEAYRICKDKQWMQRAKWLIDLIIHTRLTKKQQICYWLVDNSCFSTADLMTGNSGILHFMMRYLRIEKKENMVSTIH